jgi:hypothetical protein
VDCLATTLILCIRYSGHMKNSKKTWLQDLEFHKKDYDVVSIFLLLRYELQIHAHSLNDHCSLQTECKICLIRLMRELSIEDSQLGIKCTSIPRFHVGSRYCLWH